MNNIPLQQQDKIRELLDQRGREYGSFPRITELASALTNKMVKETKRHLHDYSIKSNNKQKNMLFFTCLMLSVKTARLLNQPNHQDTKDDIKGYIQLLVDNIASLNEHHNISPQYFLQGMTKGVKKFKTTLKHPNSQSLAFLVECLMNATPHT